MEVVVTVGIGTTIITLLVPPGVAVLVVIEVLVPVQVVVIVVTLLVGTSTITVAVQPGFAVFVVV